MQEIKSILFSPLSIKAIQEGRKSQTRRLVNPQPIQDDDSGFMYSGDHKYSFKNDITHAPWQDGFILYVCGDSIGDMLYVKEDYYQYGYWRKNGKNSKGRQLWLFIPITDQILHNDTIGIKLQHVKKDAYRKAAWYKRKARYMPKAIARIFIKLTGIRIERLQQMSQEDAQKEGMWQRPHRCPGWENPMHDFRDCFICSYKFEWNLMHGLKGFGWDKNPFVWVYEFEEIK